MKRGELKSTSHVSSLVRGAPLDQGIGVLNTEVQTRLLAVGTSAQGLLSGTRPASPRDIRISRIIDSVIQSLNERGNCRPEHFTDPQQCCHGDRSTSLYLLPVTSREAEQEHVFLRHPASLTELSHLLAKSLEEDVLIRHALRCTV